MTTSRIDGQDAQVAPLEWRDPKRYLWLFGLVPAGAMLVALGLVWASNQLGLTWLAQVWFWIGPLLIYVLLPILDQFFGPDGSNPPDELMAQLEADRYYRYCIYAYLPLQLTSIVLACYLWTADDLSWLGIDGGLNLVAKIGLAFSVGAMGGIAINTAHELGHKKGQLERWLSKVALAQTFYGHFYIEHNRGHHVRVATPEDPASARFGESYWTFLPRSVVGSAKSAWELERVRLERLGKGPFTIKNDVLNAWLMSVVLWGALVAVFGIGVLPFLVLQAAYGSMMLFETVNYLEHYGLLRGRTPAGRYERCTPEHSWNSDHIVTNIFLYHLQRHSDHHANPTRRYQTLRHFEGAPELPSGYASLIGLAYLTPLWRKVMDHRVMEHYNGDITRVNIQPSKRERFLAQYGAVTR